MNKGLMILAMALVLAALPACEETVDRSKEVVAPAPTYSGPKFLHGTIGSMTSIRGYEPILVSGYGLVVNLRGTGSADCPPALREWMLQKLAKEGFGSFRLGTADLTPEKVLADKNTAVVKVQGIIRPGAPKSTYFDLIVEALPSSQTTSLEGGLLYTAELHQGDVAAARPLSRVMASAYGPLFLNPFADPTKEEEKKQDDLRVGRVMGGGKSLYDLEMTLVLNTPSFAMSQAITDRINGWYRAMNYGRDPIANALSEGVISLVVSERFRDDPQRMLDLISHLYVNPTRDFAMEQARDLREKLEDPANQKYADSIAYVWEGMGEMVLPYLRELYEDPKASNIVHLAALQAGARLGDARAGDALYKLARSGKPGSGEREVALLADLLEKSPENLRVAEMLQKMLDSDDAMVRIAAYEGLSKVGNAMVTRLRVGGKVDVDVVRCSKPMIYITRQGTPRVVIFNHQMGIKQPIEFANLDNRLLIDGKPNEEQMEVFYKGPNDKAPRIQKIPPYVFNLVLLMANRGDKESKGQGYDLSYSEIVATLYQLTRTGSVDAPLKLQNSDLAQRIAKRRIAQKIEGRPESADSNPR